MQHHNYHHFLSLFLLALAPTACGEYPELDIASRSPAIVNGAEDTGHPTVGRIAGGAEGHCTATLIGPKTVLTAAHCLTTKGPGFIVYPISVSFTGGLSTYEAASAVVHPTYGNYYYSGDIGIVRLKQVVPGLNPSPITAVVPKVGQKVILVGFGITATGAWGTSGVKRQAGNAISAMTNDNITFSGSSGAVGNICSGDSGGPTFAIQGGIETVIGVHSTGSVPCGQSGNDIRVDLYRDWIIKEAKGDVGSTKDAQLPEIYITAPMEYDGVETSFSVKVQATDNVGVDRVVVKVDGAQAGFSSTSPFTVQLTNIKPGTRKLTAVAHDKAGNTAQDEVVVIVSQATTTAPLGEACVSNSDCKSGLCVDLPTGKGRICTDTCDPDNDTCPAGSTCQKAGGRDICLPAPSETEPTASRGGCSQAAAAPGARSAGLVGVLLLGLLSLRRRRAGS